MPSLPPLAIIATWEIPNRAQHEHRDPLVPLLVSIITCAFATVFVFGRLYIKARARNVLIEDWLILVALILSLGLAIDVCWATYNGGWMYHMWDLADLLPGIPEPLLKTVFVAKLLHGFGLAAGRTSIILFFTRLLDTRSANQWWWIWLQRGALFWINGTAVAFGIISVLNCMPVYTYWMIFDPTQKCLDEGVIVMVFAIINIFLDLMVTILPLPILLRLNISFQQRFGAIMLLCMGSIAVVCATVKVYYIYWALIGSYDQTWYLIPLWICGILENNIIVTCACIPTLYRPVLSKPLKLISERFRLSTPAASSAGAGGARGGAAAHMMKAIGAPRSGSDKSHSSSHGRSLGGGKGHSHSNVSQSQTTVTMTTKSDREWRATSMSKTSRSSLRDKGQYAPFREEEDLGALSYSLPPPPPEKDDPVPVPARTTGGLYDPEAPVRTTGGGGGGGVGAGEITRTREVQMSFDERRESWPLSRHGNLP